MSNLARGGGGPKMSEGSVPRTSVATRLMSILTAFRPGDQALTLSELAARTDLPLATVLRLTRELTKESMLERTPAGTYRIGLRLFQIGNLAPASRGLREAALPIMQDLYAVTRENVLLSVLNSADQVLYVEKLRGRDSATALTRSGGVLPPYATATGKVILAHSPAAVVDRVCAAGFVAYAERTIRDADEFRAQLEQIRQQGYAVADQEIVPGRRAVAALVSNRDRSLLAGLGVMGATERISVERLAPAVRTAALALSRRLGHRDPQPEATSWL